MNAEKIKECIKSTAEQIREYYAEQCNAEIKTYKTAEIKNLVKEEYTEELEYIYSLLKKIENVLNSRK